MKILYVSAIPCFPPVNGESIASAARMKALAQRHEVDFLLLWREGFEYDPASLAATREQARRYWEWPVRRSGKIKAAAGELFGRVPYYGALEFAAACPDEALGAGYDVVFCTHSVPAAFFARDDVRAAIPAKYYVAGLGDHHSLVVFNEARNSALSMDWRYKYLRRGILRLRSLELKRAEARMLERFDLVLMQSSAELDWTRGMGRGITGKSLILTNGVADELFDVPMERAPHRLLFVGILDFLYRQRMYWFFTEIWPKIKKAYPDARARVVGRNADAEILALFEKSGVEYTPFVPSMAGLYAEYGVLVAPIYKGYGIINKVIEAMSAGTLVVGDPTAFNAIPEFEDGKHALVAAEPENFTDRICEAFARADTLQQTREAGRELMRKHFTWESRARVLLDRMETLAETSVRP